MTRTTDLISITRDVIAAIHQFKGVLAEETEALAQRDRTLLLEIAERKIRYADYLDQLVRSRSRMFTQVGVNERDQKAVEDLFQNYGQRRLVDEDWRNAMTLLAECHAMNQQAGANIQAQVQFVNRGLEILHGKPQHATYGEHGTVVNEGYAKEIGTA
ncbi:flagellar biosynthesis/type III secretory pathway chaperone [Litorivivens lipolytica]|uniref:Flagellar biosynthesis/type III secretory pathway chaperone n=1 Tax=Litorivivens lipolytica TaxID=1524264 RepID=A0A7W4W2W0_9GAMM|nr:flagellar biosynthesis/type III secretory pathway chaperone [Litorivivens lipolytica]